VRLSVSDPVVVLHQDEIEVWAPQAAPQRAERLDHVAEVRDVRADREAGVDRVGVRAELGDVVPRDPERLALVEGAVAAEQHVVGAERLAEDVVTGVGEPARIVRRKRVAEAVEAARAEPGPTRVPVHQADARHDLVEIDDVHAEIDAAPAPLEEVVPEHVAVDAGGVHGLGLPVVPIALGLPAVDVATDLVQQERRACLLVHLRNERDQRHREQRPPTPRVQVDDLLGGGELRGRPHPVHGRPELAGHLRRHRYGRDELDLPVPLHPDRLPRRPARRPPHV
jgi:hypothetical protein